LSSIPIDSMRCSRLALTLFSYPEYVWMTYQRFSGALVVSVVVSVINSVPYPAMYAITFWKNVSRIVM
jgi:hypothetical protein